MLYVVSTPIGNLEDITLRALRVLKEVDYIAAEDTRHSGLLLKKYDIHTPMISFHAHSGQYKVDKILDMLENGKDVALISDAGTPGISDPGYMLISAALEAHIQVVPVPGASALLGALVGSGFPMDKFVYLGFLPLKKGRQTLFESLKNEKRTIIFYESAKRLEKTLKQIAGFLGGDTWCCVARELTKVHEEFIRGNFTQVIGEIEERSGVKGECTVLIKNL